MRSPRKTLSTQSKIIYGCLNYYSLLISLPHYPLLITYYDLSCLSQILARALIHVLATFLSIVINIRPALITKSCLIFKTFSILKENGETVKIFSQQIFLCD